MTDSPTGTCQQVCWGVSALAALVVVWLSWGAFPVLASLMFAGGFGVILNLSLTRIACVDKGMARNLGLVMGLEKDDSFREEATGEVKSAPEAANPAQPKTTTPASATVSRFQAPQGAPDDLTRIKGIGPRLAALCREMGVTQFGQIAGWSAEDVAWMDANLAGFRGRVSRDDWVAQAKALAGGKTPRKKHDKTPKDASDAGAAKTNLGGL